MLSELPRLIDRNFIIGFFMPALMACVVAFLMLMDKAFAKPMLDGLLAKDLSAAAYGAAVVWLFAVLLLLFNHALYRAFEGYLPPLKWCTWRKRRWWRRIQRHQREATSLRDKRATGTLTDKERGRYAWLRLWLSHVPGSERDVLPTKFGNRIKAFETYPSETYGVSSVVLWQHLTSVLPKDFAAAIQEARTFVDFHVNCCALSGLLVVLALALGIESTPFADIRTHAAAAWQATAGAAWWSVWLPVASLIPFWKFAWALAAGAACSLFYYFAVWAIPAWGNFVKAAFDCYLLKLAEQLGYSLPKNDAARRRFWQEFSDMATYRPLGGRPPAFRSEHWLFKRKK